MIIPDIILNNIWIIRSHATYTVSIFVIVQGIILECLKYTRSATHVMMIDHWIHCPIFASQSAARKHFDTVQAIPRPLLEITQKIPGEMYVLVLVIVMLRKTVLVVV